jgi:hypothetical protein
VEWRYRRREMSPDPASREEEGKIRRFSRFEIRRIELGVSDLIGLLSYQKRRISGKSRRSSLHRNGTFPC